MKALVLDSEAISQLARAAKGEKPCVVHTSLLAAVQADAPVLVPAVVLAEQYRGAPHDAQIDSLLARRRSITVVPTDRSLAKSVGNLLAKHQLGSEHHVDATVVAVAAGGGVILTSDPGDIARLAADLIGVVVEPL